MRNIREKAVTQDKYYRERISRRIRPEKNFVALKPGSIYLFWGYRTYHADMPLRLMHYG